MNNSSTKNIAIVGLGEIGSRHLQALAQCDFETKLYCIDPNIESLDRAKNRLHKLPKNSKIHSILFEESIDSLPIAIDFSVIATNADIRFQVLSDLLEKVQVDYLLLEKILFQKIDDIVNGQKLLNRYDTRAWVNCTRRMWPIYNDLREFLKDKKELSYNLNGGMWGMGCNAIHILDHFEWLTNSKLLSLDIDNLDPIIHDSKREGFIEFSGALKAFYSNQNQMLLQSDFLSKQKSFNIVIKNKDFSIIIKESLGTIDIVASNKNNKSLEKNSKFTVPYQSELTHLVAREAIFNNHSKLTPYADSADQHKLLLSALKTHADKILEKSLEICPIT